MKSPALPPLFRFALAGGIGYLVDTGLLLLLNPLLGVYLARIISFLAAMTTTWLINRNITFVPDHQQSLLTEYSRYCLTSTGGGLINLSVYTLLIISLSPTAARLPLIVAISALSGMVVNYLLARRFVYLAEKL